MRNQTHKIVSLAGVTALVFAGAGWCSDKADKPASVSISHKYVQAVVAAESSAPTPVYPAKPGTLERLLREWPQDADPSQHWQPASDHCQQDPLSLQQRICGLRWRKQNALTNAKATVEDMSYKTKAKFIGKNLADKIELDDDGVRFEVKW